MIKIKDSMKRNVMSIATSATILETHLAALYLLYSRLQKIIETTSTMSERILAKHNHDVTAAGFELKVALFILVTSISYLGLQLGLIMRGLKP